MTLDDVARLDAIGQDHDLVPHRAARRLDLLDGPPFPGLDRPQGEPRAVGALEDLTAPDPGRDLDVLPSAVTPGARHDHLGSRSAQCQETLEPAAVEADHRLAVDHRDRCRAIPEALELGQRPRVRADVLRREGNAFLRKKLFLSFAARSARLCVQHDLSGHRLPPRALIGPAPEHLAALRRRQPLPLAYQVVPLTPGRRACIAARDSRITGRPSRIFHGPGRARVSPARRNGARAVPRAMARPARPLEPSEASVGRHASSRSRRGARAPGIRRPPRIAGPDQE